MSINDVVASRLREAVAQPGFPTAAGLEGALRLLAKWRSQLIDNTVVAREGVLVQAGPFKGMTFVERVSEANVSPRLLGSYEAELHPIIEEIVMSGYERIVDIGCADGYYAVGFATRMLNVKVAAFDINPLAQQKCAELARTNEVSDRVEVHGTFSGEHFAPYAAERSLIFIDAEGAEDDLLRPDRYPALQKLAVLVECHDVFKPGLSESLAARFAATHTVRRIEPQLHCPTLPPWFSKLSHLDQLLAAWEWRAGPTPWLYMVPEAER
jgi:hypothetical protein